MKSRLLVFTFFCMMGATISAQTNAEESEWMELDNWSGGSTELRIARLEKFVKDYPQSIHATQAKKDIKYLKNEYASILFNRALKSNDPQKLQDAIDKYPGHSMTGRAKKQLRQLDLAAWNKVNKNDSLSVYRYIQHFPRGIYNEEARKVYTTRHEQQAPVALPKIKDTKDVKGMTIKELQEFVKQQPNSEHAPKAKEILAQREDFYYQHAIKLQSSYSAFEPAVKKYNALFPGGKNAAELNQLYKQRTALHLEGLNKPDYRMWNELDKSKPEQLQQFLVEFPDSKHSITCRQLLRSLDDKYYKVASTSKALPEVERYLKLFPKGQYQSQMEAIKKTITENPKYQALKKAIDDGRIESYDIGKADKNDAFILPTIELVKSYTADILFSVSLGEKYMYEIQLINFEEPYIEVHDPYETLFVDTADLKTEGIIITDVPDKKDAYLLVNDTGGRSRKIKIELTITGSLIRVDNLITLTIEGDQPPYTLQYYNVDLKTTQKTDENIHPDPDGIFMIDTDTLDNLAGTYALKIKNTATGQQETLDEKLILEDRTNRRVYFIVFSVLVAVAFGAVIRIYIKRSRQKTVFDEF